LSTSPVLTVVGLGLIGGSLVRAVKARSLPYRVVGVARRAETRRAALDCGAVDAVRATAAEAAPEGGIVVLALPVLRIPEALGEIAPHLPAGSVVTDVGSTKLALVREAARILPDEVAFVGGHPIAGTENSGFDASFPELFDGARCILTPGENSPDDALSRVRALWEAVGSRVEIMDPALHDRILAVISHLPHIVAYALVNAAAAADSAHPGLLDYTGGGFRDFTRIAASHSVMWRDICLDNRDEVLQAVDSFIEEVSHLRDLVRERDAEGLQKAFEAARTVRRSLTQKKDGGRS
jgi:prephenate dehydrogenase